MYKLELYISGHTPKIDRSIKSLRETLDRECEESYKLCVLDVFQNLEKAYEDNIVVTPTLIKKEPSPSTRIFGDLSDGLRVLSNLRICIEQ